MARGMNHVFLIGSLARDAELRYTQTGLAICDLTVAGEDSVIGSDGQARTLPWYHRVSLLGKPAEAVADLKAGQAVLVEGSLEQRSWETPEGAKRNAINIKALRIDNLQRPETDLIRDTSGGLRLQRAMNQTVLVGNLGRDPEVRFTPSGDAVVSFSIAVSESWRGKDGNWQEKTHWIDVNAWRDLAEFVGNLKKGDSLLIHGRIKNESWTDKDGSKRNITKVEATRVEAVSRGMATGVANTTPSGSQKAFGNANTVAGATGNRSGSLDIDEGLNDLPPEDDLPF